MSLVSLRNAAFKAVFALFLAWSLLAVGWSGVLGEAPWHAVAHAQPVTLNYWHHYGGVFGEVIEELIAEFNETHPHIRVVSQYAGTAWTARDKLFIALAGGGGPDVGLIDQFWASQLADAGFIQKMEEFLPGDFDRADIPETIWETAVYDETIWSMPAAVSNLVLYINRDLFREAGLDPDAPPTDWNQLLEVGRRLTQDVNGDGSPDQWGLDMPLTAQSGSVYYWITFLWQAGGELFTPGYQAAAFHSDEGVATLKYWQRLLQEGVVTLSPPASGWERGLYGMQIGSSARLNAVYKPTVAFEFGVAPVPQDQVKVTGLGGNNIAIYTDDPVKMQAAWEFVQWLSSTEVNRYWAVRTGYAPIRKSVLESEEFQAYLQSEPRARVGVDEMSFARSRPNIPAYADASRVLGLAVEHAMFGNLDPVKTLQDAAAEVDLILEEYR